MVRRWSGEMFRQLYRRHQSVGGLAERVSVAAYEPNWPNSCDLPHMVHPIKVPRPGPWVRGEDRRSPGPPLFGRTFPWQTRNGASRTRSGPKPVAAPSSVGRPAGRNSTGWIKGSRKAAGQPGWMTKSPGWTRSIKKHCKAARSCPVGRLYQSVKGVGILTAAILAADPELGQGDGKCLTSLVGLAPWSRDSGRQRGYRAIRGGRGTVRRAVHGSLVGNPKQEQRPSALYNQLKKRQAKWPDQMHALPRRSGLDPESRCAGPRENRDYENSRTGRRRQAQCPATSHFHHLVRPKQGHSPSERSRRIYACKTVTPNPPNPDHAA